MKPFTFLIGLFLTIYVIVEWLQGTISYSFEGWIGTGTWKIINYFRNGFMPMGEFLTIVYLLTLLIGIWMMHAGMRGRHEKED